MIKIGRDAEHNAIVVEFSGDVDAPQAERAFRELGSALERAGSGFKALVDFSAAGTLEPDVEAEVLRAMDLLDTRGVSEVIRVLPDPELAVGFNRLSMFHYSPRVRIRNVASRAEAEPLLRGVRT